MAIGATILAFLLVLPAAYAVEYTVGGSSGWSQGVDYDSWASGKTFSVGDTLLFSYGGSHSVDVVTKAGYDSCSSNSAIEKHSDGNTKITLDKTGSMYFLCPFSNHCSGGQKLTIKVSAATGGSPTTPSTTTPETPTTTPSTTTPKPDNGAYSSLSNMNIVVVGAGVILAYLVAFLG